MTWPFSMVVMLEPPTPALLAGRLLCLGAAKSGLQREGVETRSEGTVSLGMGHEKWWKHAGKVMKHAGQLMKHVGKWMDNAGKLMKHADMTTEKGYHGIERDTYWNITLAFLRLQSICFYSRSPLIVLFGCKHMPSLVGGLEHFFMFPDIQNVIIPIESYFSEGQGSTTNQKWSSLVQRGSSAPMCCSDGAPMW